MGMKVPTTAGSAPSRRRQKASVRIATGAAPAASSSARKARPSRGGTPRTSKAFAVTSAARHALGIATLTADIDVGRRAGRHRQRLARLGVVEVLGVRQRRRGAPVPPVPHRNQAIGIGIRQRLEEHRVDYAEDCGVGSDPEGERQDGNGDEAGIAAHAAEGVADVLRQLRGVLARTDGQQRADVLEPDAERARGAGRVTLLGAERARYLVAVVGAEVERQEPEEPAEPALARHAGRTLGMSFFARAIPSAVSIRAASARATSRPNVVNR